jgi:hypothetical protein
VKSHQNIIDDSDSWPTVLGIAPVSELLAKDLQDRRKQNNLSVQTTKHNVASVPTHRATSDDNWPMVLGIVPVS